MYICERLSALCKVPMRYGQNVSPSFLYAVHNGRRSEGGFLNRVMRQNREPIITFRIVLNMFGRTRETKMFEYTTDNNTSTQQHQ